VSGLPIHFVNCSQSDHENQREHYFKRAFNSAKLNIQYLLSLFEQDYQEQHKKCIVVEQNSIRCTICGEFEENEYIIYF